MADLATLVPQNLLEILRCPLQRTPLSWVPAEWVGWLNEMIERKELRNRSGELVQEKILGALWNADRSLIYPVYEHGATLLIEEAFEVASLPPPPGTSCTQTPS
jgi:uncharacterized protein YbaR (Trm112 family)